MKVGLHFLDYQKMREMKMGANDYIAEDISIKNLPKGSRADRQNLLLSKLIKGKTKEIKVGYCKQCY